MSDGEALDAIGRGAALRHWLTEECGCCGATGGHGADEAETCRGRNPKDPSCIACDSRGWRLIHGIEWRVSSRGGEVAETIEFPLDWLGDDQ